MGSFTTDREGQLPHEVVSPLLRKSPLAEHSLGVLLEPLPELWVVLDPLNNFSCLCSRFFERWAHFTHFKKLLYPSRPPFLSAFLYRFAKLRFEHFVSQASLGVRREILLFDVPLEGISQPRSKHQTASSHYGLLANGSRADNVALARRLPAVHDHDPRPDAEIVKAVDEPKATELSCPACGGWMMIIETFEAGAEPTVHHQRDPPEHRISPS
jgi:hypothetical protein